MVRNSIRYSLLLRAFHFACIPDRETKAMPDAFAELRHELAVANRILANEGIIDAFGHISVRNPNDPGRYFISQHRASELVEPSELLAIKLKSKPALNTNVRLIS